VHEALPVAGGMLRVGIPEDRLPRAALKAEIDEIEAAGVGIRLSSPVESIDHLLDDDYDAVLLAVGTHRGVRLPVPGAESERVLLAVDFLRAVHLGEDVSVGERVLVLGGGNVAFDCARVALTLGATSVEVSCLEGRQELPASPEEVAAAEALGVVVHDSRTFRGISADDGGVCTVECLQVESFSFDDEGRLEVEEVWGSDHTLEADTIILALGQKPSVPEEWGVDLTETGLVYLDEYTFDTNREGVFAAGDAVSGTASAVRAIASGRKAASVVDRYLGGDGELDEELTAKKPPSPFLGPGVGFAGRDRESLPLIDDQGACGESERCLQCDLRLSMTRVRFWGDY
jgi:formate dehydrogenase beta subunit